MFGDGPLTFQEFAAGEPLPLATIHDSVLEFLCGRADMVLCGAQAVNAYVDTPRMTQDVDLLASATHAQGLVKEIRSHLQSEFQIELAVCQRMTACRAAMGESASYAIVQPRKSQSRHLVDVHPVCELPRFQTIETIRVALPEDVICSKVRRLVYQRMKPRAGLEQADLWRLLLTFPKLKVEEGPVAVRLRAAGASKEVMATWKDLVAQEIESEDEDAGF